MSSQRSRLNVHTRSKFKTRKLQSRKLRRNWRLRSRPRKPRSISQSRRKSQREICRHRTMPTLSALCRRRSRKLLCNQTTVARSSRKTTTCSRRASKTLSRGSCNKWKCWVTCTNRCHSAEPTCVKWETKSQSPKS